MLPTELLEFVLQSLTVLDLGAVICAEYRMLRRRGIVERITLLTALHRSSTGPRASEVQSRTISSNLRKFPLPFDLWLHLDPLMSYTDKLSLASAMVPILVVKWNVGLQEEQHNATTPG